MLKGIFGILGIFQGSKAKKKLPYTPPQQKTTTGTYDLSSVNNNSIMGGGGDGAMNMNDPLNPLGNVWYGNSGQINCEETPQRNDDFGGFGGGDGGGGGASGSWDSDSGGGDSGGGED